MNAHPSTSPGLRTAALLLAFASALACSAILEPHDQVTRCNTTDDCGAIKDKRYTSACAFDEAHADLDTTKYDRICVAVPKPNVGCDPAGYMVPDNPFMKAVDSCGDLGCDMANDGRLGCPPNAGACMEGSLVTFGQDGPAYCGDSEIVPGFALSDDLENQHVKDAFCKSFFCDDTFVCNNTTHKCVPCDDGAQYGEGGCGIVYADGMPAPVYLLGGALDRACAHGKADVNKPVFGGGCGE